MECMDDLLERVQQTGAPLVDDETATFLWEGDQAPQLVGDFNGWGRRSSETLFRKVALRVWRCTIPLPSDAYLEYSFRLGGERIHDPLNPNLVSDGVGGFHKWFSMPGFHETPLTEEQPHGVKGTVTHHEVECGMFAMGETRTVRLYQPPVDEACPLLVVLDGQEYLERGRLVNIVDNLIGEGRIRPINMALVDHGGRARVIEYNCSDSTIGFLERVETLAREHLSLLE